MQDPIQKDTGTPTRFSRRNWLIALVVLLLIAAWFGYANYRDNTENNTLQNSQIGTPSTG